MFSKKRVSLECFIAALIFMAIAAFVTFQSPTTAYASEILYSNDGISFWGEGTPIPSSETIYWDNYVVHDEYFVDQAPSYGVAGSVDNFCAPAAGTNIIGFYDRFYPNLIPNFEPGMMNNGHYWYLPNMHFASVVQTFNDLYDLMGTNQNGAGTSGEQFKNGLKKFVNNHGYNLSYGSFYQNRTGVNINSLQGMIASNKVGVLLCTKYNFVYDIIHGPNETFISKSDYTLAHMMMVYGYITIDYYKDGQIFRSDTYLQVSSGYSTGDQGYVLINNNSMEIQEALIVNIS